MIKFLISGLFIASFLPACKSSNNGELKDQPRYADKEFDCSFGVENHKVRLSFYQPNYIVARGLYKNTDVDYDDWNSEGNCELWLVSSSEGNLKFQPKVKYCPGQILSKGGSGTKLSSITAPKAFFNTSGALPQIQIDSVDPVKATIRAPFESTCKSVNPKTGAN